MKRLTCDVCGKQFDATKSRSWGSHCERCAGWLRALAKDLFKTTEHTRSPTRNSEQ